MSTIVAVCIVFGLLFPGIAAQQDYCKLAPETGPCTQNVQKYYYDTSNQTCQQFTYGGCNGNLNRFNSTEDCLSTCHRAWNCSRQYAIGLPFPFNEVCRSTGFFDFLQRFGPSIFLGLHSFADICGFYIKETCVQPQVTGPCLGNCSKFYYNASAETCQEFEYSGCDGNDNQFETQLQCEETCNGTLAPNQTSDICLLPPERGPCFGQFHRFFHNSTSGKCEPFVYGGCEGNENRFTTKQECDQKCSGESTTAQPPNITCLLPAKTGPCSASLQKFFFNSTSAQCEDFIYGGCLGNENRFETIQECQNICNDTSAPPLSNDTCLLPAETGPCKAYISRFFYNSTYGQCQDFIYGGCQGNDNRFETKEECQNVCRSEPSTQPPIDPCLLPPETGPCKGYFPRFFYNSTSGKCENFVYGGCQGNDNRFATKSDCNSKCQRPLPDKDCDLPPDKGPCCRKLQKYFYNKTADACQLFTYGGCQGNNNRFDSELQCQHTCGCSVL